METVLVVLRVVLAAVFVAAAVGKFLDREGSRQALTDFGVSERLVGPGAVILPVAESVVAVALLPAGFAVAGAAGAFLLLALFCAGIVGAMARGEAPDCHCFGQLHSEPAGPKTLVRNGILAALAAVVVIAGPGPQLTTWLGERTPFELVALAAATAAVVGVLVWARRRAVVRAAREALRPGGLPVGAPAPGFALSRLGGGTVRLEDLAAQGRPVVLVFTHPECGPCGDLMPDLARWQRALAERVTIALISQGGEARNREAHADDDQVDNVLLEHEGGDELFKTYGMRGTPSAVAVTPDGRIATVTTESDIEIEQLLRHVLHHHTNNHETEPARSDPARI